MLNVSTVELRARIQVTKILINVKSQTERCQDSYCLLCWLVRVLQYDNGWKDDDESSRESFVLKLFSGVLSMFSYEKKRKRASQGCLSLFIIHEPAPGVVSRMKRYGFRICENHKSFPSDMIQSSMGHNLGSHIYLHSGRNVLAEWGRHKRRRS